MPREQIQPAAMGRLLPRAALLKVPRQSRSIEMVHLILDAATTVIESEGMAGFNTNRVAEVAGVSVGSLYQYFGSKEAILLGIVERGLAQADDAMRLAVEGSEEDDPVRQVEGLLAALTGFLRPRRAVLRSVLASSPLLAETGFLAMVEGRSVDLLRAVAQRHQIHDYGPADMYVAVNALCLLFLKWSTSPPPYLSEVELFRSTARMVIGALRQHEQNAN